MNTKNISTLVDSTSGGDANNLSELVGEIMSNIPETQTRNREIQIEIQERALEVNGQTMAINIKPASIRIRLMKEE